MIDDYIKKNTLKIIVRPGSAKSEIIGWDDSRKALRINIKAPPQKGKANAEVLKFFSKKIKKKVEIKSGLSSREKILKIC